MKIQTIEISNYKAFHGRYDIKVGGKNLFIYGENGSGKSSLYYALKDLFQASIEDIDLNGSRTSSFHFLPQAFKHWDMIEEMKTFYIEVYGKTITSSDAERILNGLGPR